MRGTPTASSRSSASARHRTRGLSWFQATRASKALLLLTVLLAQLGVVFAQAPPADRRGRFVFYRGRDGGSQGHPSSMLMSSGSGFSTRRGNGPQQGERRQQIAEVAMYEVRTSHAANPAVHIDIASALEGTYAKKTHFDTWVFLGGQERISTVKNVAGVVSIETIDPANKVIALNPKP